MSKNKYYDGPVSDHFDGERFHGPGAVADKSRRDLWRLYRTPFAPWPRTVANPPPAPIAQRIAGGALRVTTIGHASHLIQTRGVNVLVDPVWSERASPFTFAGPKRVAAPGLPLDALPPIDAVLITHNHYDHLDLATLDRLLERAPTRIVVPLGNDTIINRWIEKRRGVKIDIEAYDWSDAFALADDVRVTLVPCHHWSARSLGDRRMALWAAYVIETPDGAIYHIGDTSYRDGEIFRDIPRRFGAPRLAIIPIGAYAPRWFMRDQHVEPGESLAIFRDCRAHFGLAHHWGTFQLTAEPIDEPPRRLAAALAATTIYPGRIRVQRPGEAFDVPAVQARRAG